MPAIIADVDIEIWLVEFRGLYRAGRWAYRQGQGDRGWTLDLLAGGRYTSLEQEITFKVAPLPQLKADQSWTDPIVGGCAIFDLTERWAFRLRTDIGGFGVGSDFTFNGVGMFDYRYVGWGLDMDILAGYRGLYEDYSSGSGPTAFVWKIWMHGGRCWHGISDGRAVGPASPAVAVQRHAKSQTLRSHGYVENERA